jgi:hypothetical protein
MGRACNTNGGDDNFSRKQKGTDHLKVLGRDWEMILYWVLIKI